VEKKLKDWRDKVHLICADVSRGASSTITLVLIWHLPPNPLVQLPADMPMRVLAATAGDQYRKPGIGLYELLLQLYEAKGLKVGTFWIASPRDHLSSED
jgi:hypothetical protein